LRRVRCGSDRDGARVRRVAGGRVAEMANAEAFASIGVRRNQRQRRPKRISPAACALATALLLLLCGPRARAGAPAGGGRWLLTSTPQHASGKGMRDTRVWLPPSYDKPESATRRYPVVVFLHGWPGAEGNWPGQGRAGQTLGAMIAAGRIPEVIGLFPDGTGTGVLGRSLWLDSWDGRARLETFLVHDLFAWADSAFRTRTDAAHRAVIGLSDGATAALNLLIRDPGVFGAAGAHSGDYLIQRDLSNGHIFGPEPGASRLRDENSPLLTVAGAAGHLRGVTIYLDCGEDDTSIRDNRALHARLDSLGVPHTYAEYAHGHDWTYWRTHLVQSLEAVTRGMR
jgi:enterochelin esterase-like enzyme